jgi:transcription elongation factor GreA
MPDTDRLMTPEGFEKLKAEVEHLETAARSEIADRIREARAHGDLSENAEYHAAKNDQALLETRIARLQERLRGAQVVARPAASALDTVSVGVPVKIEDTKTGAAHAYTIVGAHEADPRAGKVSSSSPVGRALLGARVGQSVSVTTPGGERRFTVTTIGEEG